MYTGSFSMVLPNMSYLAKLTGRTYASFTAKELSALGSVVSETSLDALGLECFREMSGGAITRTHRALSSSAKQASA